VFASVQIVCLFLTFIVLLQPAFKSSERAFTLLGLAWQNVLLVVVSITTVRRRMRPDERDSLWSLLGLSVKEFGGHAVSGIGWGLVLFLLAAVVVVVTVTVFESMGMGRELESMRSHSSRVEVEKLLGSGPVFVWLSTFLVVVAAPIAEEVFFRGFLYRGLKTHMPPWSAGIISSGVFALIHASPLEASALFMLGLTLAWRYERSGSLIVPIFAHATNNGLSTLILLATQGRL
jgi:membrane protease YdiL (CAAX protease family)